MLVSDGTGRDYLCQAEEIAGLEVTVRILETEEEERASFQNLALPGLPKSDKMEFIIQKAVELGAETACVPVHQNTVVKLDPKKEEAKVKGGRPLRKAPPSSPNGPGSQGIRHYDLMKRSL